MVVTPLISLSRHRWLAYAVAVVGPLAALLLVRVLGRSGHIVPVYPIFIVAVIVSALLGGVAPGLMAVGLSLLSIYAALSSRYIPLVGQRSAWLSFIVFGLIGAFVSAIVGVLGDSQKALRERRSLSLTVRVYR